MDNYTNIIKYLQSEEYDKNALLKEVEALSKTDNVPKEICKLLNVHTSILLEEIPPFIDSICYDYKEIEIDGYQTQIYDNAINLIKPFVYLPYKGRLCVSKNFDIKIDYLLYESITKDTIFKSENNTFYNLMMYLIKKLPITYFQEFNQSIEDRFDYVDQNLKDFIKKYDIRVSDFYENFNLNTKAKRDSSEERINENFEKNPNNSKSIGDKGELLVFEKLNEIKTALESLGCETEVEWVSNFINDSFNYDFSFYITSSGEEHAIEVKTTASERNYGKFKLSKREFHKYLKGFNYRKKESRYRHLSTYTILNVLIDKDKILNFSIYVNLKNNPYFEILKDYIKADHIKIDYNYGNIRVNEVFFDERNLKITESDKFTYLSNRAIETLKEFILITLYEHMYNYYKNIAIYEKGKKHAESGMVLIKKN